MKTLNKKITSISIGGNTPKGMRVAPHVGTQKDAKQVFMIVSGKMVRIYDDATYKFDVGGAVSVGVRGGAIDLRNQITSQITHGDGVVENKGYSGNPLLVLPVNYDEVPHSGILSFRQFESDLAESISWTQAADYVVTYGNIVVDEFWYNDALVDGTAAYPVLSYHQQLTWASGRVTTITSGATILWSGQYVGNDGKVQASAITSEKARTKLTTANVSISNGGKSVTLSCDVYQEANSVISLYAYATDSSVARGGETIRIYAIGTLKSGNTIDISNRVSWSKVSGATTVSFSTSGTSAYAEFGENFSRAAETIKISATDTATARDFNNDFGIDFLISAWDDITFTQVAGSAYGTLYISMSNPPTNAYLNYTGASMLSTYAKGILLSGKLRFSGNSLEDWGGLNQYSALKDFGLYNSPSSSATLLKVVPLSASQVNGLKTGTDVNITI